MSRFYGRVHEQVTELHRARITTPRHLIIHALPSVVISIVVMFLLANNDGKIDEELTYGFFAFVIPMIFTWLIVFFDESPIKYLNGHYAAVLNDPRCELVDSYREAYDAFETYKAEHNDLISRIESGIITLDEALITAKTNELNHRFMQIHDRGCKLEESFKRVEFGKLAHRITEHLVEDIERRKIENDEALVEFDNRLKAAEELDKSTR